MLIFFPVVSFAVPSVRMLGSGTRALTPAAKSQITPVKSEKKSAETSLATARVGTLKTKVKSSQTTTQNTTDSRFPVVVSANSYNSVNSPEQGQNTSYTSGGSADVGAIVETVMQNVSYNYYNKTEVYNKEEIDDRLDDPRFDAIRIVRGRNGSVPSNADYPTNLPSNYIYMWIEED